jgi:hypothetical protein
MQDNADYLDYVPARACSTGPGLTWQVTAKSSMSMTWDGNWHYVLSQYTFSLCTSMSTHAEVEKDGKVAQQILAC